MDNIEIKHVQSAARNVQGAPRKDVELVDRKQHTFCSQPSLDILFSPGQSPAVRLLSKALDLEDQIRHLKQSVSSYGLLVRDEYDKAGFLDGNNNTRFSEFSYAVKLLEDSIDLAFRHFIAARSLFAEDFSVRLQLPSE